MGNKKETKKGPNRVVALVTYIIALLALLLGLFLPWSTDAALNGTKDAILAFQLPQAFKAAVPVEALGELIGDAGSAFTSFTFPITLNGVIDGGYDLGALVVVLYALVTLAGLIALIPAIVNTASKKSKKNVALNAASFIEAVAFLFVSILVFIQLTNLTLLAQLNNALPDLGAASAEMKTTYQWSYPLLGAFGGIFLMMVVQSIFYKKGSGVFKFILLLLSTLALMLAVYDIGAIITQLEKPLSELIGKTGDLFDGKLYNLGESMVGITPVLMLFCGLPTNLTDALEGMEAIQQTLLLCSLILALLAIINFLLDGMGLCKTTKRYMLISNIVRYVLELVAAALVVILPFFIDGATTGLMGLVIAVLALVALILNVIRLVRYNKKNKKAKKAAVATGAATTGAVATGAVATGVAANESPATEQHAVNDDEPFVYTPPVYATEEKKDEAPEVYNPVIYNGPTDEFINTLSNDQKIEFSRVFLERQNGNLSYVPDYVVGNKNDRFFNSIFVYFARLRAIVSDGLFNKMYEYCNLM